MSLLMGTIKNKTGILRQFKNMSLKELEFNVEEEYDTDGIDETEFTDEGSVAGQTSKKRVRTEKTSIDEEEAGTATAIKKEKTDVGIKVKTEKDLKENTGDNLKKFTGEGLPHVPAMKLEGVEETTDSENDPKMKKRNTFLMKRLNAMYGYTSGLSVEEVLKVLENVYLYERHTVIGDDKFISTPLHSLKQIASRYGETIHNEVIYIANEELPKPLVRVEFYVGSFRGIGEAFNKRMAAQLAAIDVLMRIEKVTMVDYITPFAIFPGWRIRPQVCEDLMLFCQKNGLKYPRYILKTNVLNPVAPSCTVEVSIGKEIIGEGKSDLAYVARKLAALNAIESMTGDKYPLEYVAFGSACTSYEELIESGHVPVISEAKKQWLLDETALGISSAARGMAPMEFDVMEEKLFIEEMKELKLQKREITITTSTASNDGERKVQVRE